MTQTPLDCTVAGATGESPRTIHHRGFSVLGNEQEVPETEDLALVVACPFCGRAVPYPGRCREGAVALAECLRCDVYFDCAEADVSAADPALLSLCADGGGAAASA